MSLERKDVRTKVDADVHEAMVRICRARGIEIAAFVESILVPEVKRIVHEANIICSASPLLGKSGSSGE